MQFFRKCLFVERRVQTHRIYPADLSAPRVNADAADRRLYVVCRQTGQPACLRNGGLLRQIKRQTDAGYHQAHWLPPPFPCTVRGRLCDRAVRIVCAVCLIRGDRLIRRMRVGDLNLDLDILLDERYAARQTDGRSHALDRVPADAERYRIVGQTDGQVIHIDLLQLAFTAAQLHLDRLGEDVTVYGVFSCAVSFHANLET